MKGNATRLIFVYFKGDSSVPRVEQLSGALCAVAHVNLEVVILVLVRCLAVEFLAIVDVHLLPAASSALAFAATSHHNEGNKGGEGHHTGNDADDEAVAVVPTQKLLDARLVGVANFLDV